MKKTYFEKQITSNGRTKYVPIAEYDSQYLDSFSKGIHIVMCYPGGQSRRYNIDPEFAPLIAAGRYAEDTIAAALREASALRPTSAPLTPKQLKAWKALADAYGEEKHALTWPAARDATEATVEALQKEADVLLSNAAVRKAYDNFMLICQLTKEEK